MTQSIVATYVQEAAEILEGLEATLLELEVRPDPAKVDEVFRGLHTVKGSGAMFGFEALARFTHHFESAFERVREGSLRIDRTLIDLALAARDRMAAFLALGGDGPQAEALAAEPATLSILARLAELTGAEAPAAVPVRAAAAGARKRRFDIRFTPFPDAIRNGMKPERLLSELAELGRLEVRYLTGSVPPLQELAPDDSALGYWLTIETEAGRDAIDEVFIFASDSDLVITEIEEPAEAAEAAGPRPKAEVEAPASARNASSENVRVPAKRLDEMMDQLGELVISQSRLQQICDNIGDPALESIVEEMQRLVTSLRDSTLSIRMLPIEVVFEKFRRVVRSLGEQLGKEVCLEVSGGATEVDKNVIDGLSEPLVHMIRNAMDHGVEPGEVRAAAGKPRQGRLRLSAMQEGGEVLIAVEDDGRGLDVEAIRRRAVERGLIAQDAQLPEREIFRLIFEPGFSTAEVVSSVSGRGVGMDVVKRTIETLRGSIDVASQPGRGTRITLRLPVTLAIIEGLLVRLGRAIYALPLANVDECVEVPAAEQRHDSGRTMVRIRDAMIPFLDLGRFFRQPVDDGTLRRVVVVHAEGRRVGLVVDDILGQNQTVIKTLSPYHRDIGIFSGATILGDGRVALIVDVGQLVKTALTRSAESAGSQDATGSI